MSDHFHNFVMTHKGALEKRCPENHGPSCAGEKCQKWVVIDPVTGEGVPGCNIVAASFAMNFFQKLAAEKVGGARR